MRVALIDVNCKFSSTGKIVYDLYTQLLKDGHEAAILYGRGPLVRETNIHRISPKWEVNVHAGLARITGLNGYFSFIATRRFISYLKKFKPDVVHCHQLHGYYVNIYQVIKYLEKNNCKVVWTLHSEYMYTGKCGYAFECEKWKSKCGNCPQLRAYPKSFFMDFTSFMLKQKNKYLSKLNSIIYVTPAEVYANRVRASFLKGSKITAINNGIDINVFYPRNIDGLRKRLMVSDRKVILSIGNNLMSDIKGGRWILKLADELKDTPITFIMVGVTNISELPKLDNVKYYPLIEDQNEIAEFYSLADITLIPSRRETYSMPVVESLSCGTPVVGFKAGAPETIAIPEYSKFVEYGDIYNLKDTLISMLEFKQNLDENEIYIKAHSKYSKENMYKNYLEKYNELLNNIN